MRGIDEEEEGLRRQIGEPEQRRIQMGQQECENRQCRIADDRHGRLFQRGKVFDPVVAHAGRERRGDAGGNLGADNADDERDRHENADGGKRFAAHQIADHNAVYG